ncbi:MAG: hypothetical protein ACP5PX_03385 [Candidatus Hadarchaeum sp.]|uniref:hypothetical protein n=1 Tax=Candidatus Hadarchaeum sp. TaxID=2883567 RepID=UPI003D12ED9D
MGEGEDLWKEHCSFLEKPFSEQLEINLQSRDEYFKRWQKTKMAAKLCPNGVKGFEEVPLTTYEDYTILHDFGEKVEQLSRTIPREKEELWWDYYLRIGRMAAPMLDGWLPEEFDFCAKTSGSSGKSKWLAYGRSFRREWDSLTSYLIIMCSEKSGDTNLRKGDTYLNIVAPAPYASGFQMHPIEKLLRPIPPRSVTDNISNMRKKMWIILKEIEKGARIDIAGGIASTFYMMARYFTKPDEFFKDYYQSMNFGITKFLLFLKYLQCKMKGKKYNRAREILPVKGIGLGGYDTRLYLDSIKEEFGVIPTNAYGCTEFGMVMYGHSDRKLDLIPDLRNMYFEFLTETGEIKRIDELKKGRIYELVGTPFGTMLMRYRIGDKFRLVDFRDDGLPIFEFEGRENEVIDIYGYFRISQAVAVKALCEAGLKETDRWCLTKVTDPKERLLLLMEPEWDYPEEKTAELIFNALYRINPEFKNYVDDFGIKTSQELVEVRYLKKGAFMRYSMKKMKEGVPIGNIKPPKIVVSDKSDAIEVLRSV